MGSRTHNKRRNVGLMMEFLVRTVSGALITGDKDRSKRALKLIKRYFKPGTELHKEFRLVNSLVKTHVSSEAVAAGIIGEARCAARQHDSVALDREKSFLIHDVNRTLNDDGSFYDQQVDEYRTYATVQTLVNDWRATDADLSRVAQYEDSLVKHLTEEKVSVNADVTISDETPGTARLLMKVLTKRLNERWNGVLNPAQRELIRAYAFSAANDDQSSVRLKLVEIREKLLTELTAFRTKEETRLSSQLASKLDEAKERLLAEVLDIVDDATVTRFMLYTRLGDELVSNEGEE